MSSGGRQRRRGVSLVEVMVVIAILLALMAIAVPSLSAYLQLEQRRSAKDIALTYELLHDEAVLRNVTFRLAYHLDENFWEVEVGRPDTLIFDDPEKLKDYEEKLQSRLHLLTEKERALEASGDETAFDKLQETFKTNHKLPRNTRFRGVWTAQYGELQRPAGEGEDPVVVYSYIFPNGFAEHAVIQLVEEGTDDQGFTIEVEPLSGRVHMIPEIKEPEEFDRDLPEEGPKLD